MKKQLPFYFLLCLFINSSFGQDVWLQNHFSPNSGCNLSTNETVTVLVNNNSAVIMPSNSINVSYTINGGSVTSQLLSSNLTAGASWNFSFSITADLSVCGQHDVKVWVSRAGDLNHLNDTLRYSIQNSCTVIPGTIDASGTVCKENNQGILTLQNRNNGTITGWESSIDGNNWTGLSETSNQYHYSNVSQATSYRVLIDGGFCPDAISDTAILSITTPERGTIGGSLTFSTPTVSGQLTLSGISGTVNFWEYSTDLNSWLTVTNTTTSLDYVNIANTTWYRANTANGNCLSVYSDTAKIFYNPPASINDPILSKQVIQVFPNPADQFLEIYLDWKFESGLITIMNSSGNVILKDQCSQNFQSDHKRINTHLLPAGIYFIRIVSETGTRSGKFIKGI
jgi:hypothetical protein